MKNIIKRIAGSILVCILCINISFAQKILTGTVVNDKGELLFGSLVNWQSTNIGVYADENGLFSIPRPDTTAILLVSYVGYEPVEIEILPTEDSVMITVSGIVALSQVEIRAQNRDNYVSTLSTRAIEHITSNELRKAACCNLSESFETNGTVSISYADAVTGAKEIEMLGLRGLYTQLLIDNRSTLNGLITPFALNYIPGTWLESISVAKGTGSVLNGSTSISGQINASIVKPSTDKAIFVNTYLASTGRTELNIHLNKKLNDKFSTGLLLHGNFMQNKHDTDGDNFLDMPNNKQLNAMYRFFYQFKNVEGNINTHAFIDETSGGQYFHHNHPTDIFSTLQKTKRIEIFGNTGYIGFKEPYKSIGSKYHLNYHSFDAIIGDKIYSGTQKGALLDILHATIVSTTDHKVTFGLSNEYIEIHEAYNNEYLNHWKELTTSVYGEYTFDRVDEHTEKGWGVILGLRGDYHSKFGFIPVPRLNLKYNFNHDFVLRFTAGRGYRTPRIITDNFSAMVSNRYLVFEAPQAEKAWNFGINSGNNFKLFNREASLNLDVFYTTFQNQYIYDAENNFDKIVFYNLKGKSFAQNVLLMFNYNLSKNFDIKIAGKYNDTRTTFNGNLLSQPLLPKFRGLVTLDFKSNNKKWLSTTTLQWVGKQRLPNNSNVPSEYLTAHPAVADAYFVLNEQITFIMKKNFEWYLGGENLTGFRQLRPIIQWEDPNGNYFNAAQIYAPTFGARIYLGTRFWIDQK